MLGPVYLSESSDKWIVSADLYDESGSLSGGTESLRSGVYWRCALRAEPFQLHRVSCERGVCLRGESRRFVVYDGTAR